MKRLLAVFHALVLAILIPALAMPANMYWKSTYADLAAISGLVNGDRGIVISTTGVASFYARTNGAWVLGGSSNIYFNIADYGAISDGTYDSPTKLAANRAAIVAAIAAAVNPNSPTYTAGTVLIPIGNCMWSGGDIEVPAGVNILGLGNDFNHGSGLGSSDNSALVLTGGYSKVSDLFLYGAGLRLDHSNHNNVRNVSLRGWDEAGTIGLDLFVSIWNTIEHVDVTHYDNGIVLRPEANGDDTINNCTFIGVKSKDNLNHGFVSRGSYGNTYSGCDFENNGGRGIYYTTYNGVETPDSYFAWIIGYRSASDTWTNLWLEANAKEDIYIFGGASMDFTGLTLAKTIGATYSPIYISNSKNIKISGKMGVNASAYIDRAIKIYGSYGVDLSGLDWWGHNVYVDQGIGTIYPNESPSPKAPERILSNASFNVLGGSPFGSWTSSGAGAGTGTITADNTDLIRPWTHSQYSALFTNEASPAGSLGIYQNGTVSASTLYYFVVEYKNDTWNPNNPLNVLITDVTNTKYWNPITWAWDNVQSSDEQLPLPISEVPTRISIPFLTQDNTATVRAGVYFFTSGANAASNIAHIYSANIQTSKWPNPPTDWTSAPTWGSPIAGEFVYSTNNDNTLGWKYNGSAWVAK